MKWNKIGRVYCASGDSPYRQSGGRVPLALHLGGEQYRLFFATYDLEGRGRIFCGEFDLSTPTSLSEISPEPVVDIGALGFFDDNGVIPSGLVETDGALYLYTSGFSVKNQIIFDSAGGLAVSHDRGRTFRKEVGPVLDRGVDDPCFATSPWVMKSGDQWRMWHVSCERWSVERGNPKHHYNIKHKVSQDGVYWDPHSTVCIDFASDLEYAIARPSVLQLPDGSFRMWYSFRAQPGVDTYRIGYAESPDGLAWTRLDREAGIDVSDDGWDSDMICYPFVFEHMGDYFMLYNGNGYGKSGFGLAQLEGEL